MSLQKEIVKEFNILTETPANVEIIFRSAFIQDYLSKSGAKSLVLGISGGQDSTLAGKLSQMAVEELRERTGDESYQFYALRLPYGEQADMDDVDKVMEFINPDHDITINIKETVDTTVNSLENIGIEVTDFNKGNIKARERMVVQYAVAGATQGLVVGSDHPAESVTGFFTKYGDGAADIMPLYHLTKRKGREMLEILGLDPELLDKTPTADLEEEKPMISDEEVLGVSYDEIDDYLEGKEIDPDKAKIIENLYNNSRHKRTLPIGPLDEY